MSKSKTVAVIAATSIALTIGGTIAAAPANAAKLEVGVAPSPNGYVMADTPTQIATNRKAKIYTRAGGKWMLLGRTTKAKSLPVTFSDPGVQTLKVKYGKKSKTIKVGVYDTFHLGKKTPTRYGDSIITSAFLGNGGASYPLPAEAGCVSVRGGINNNLEVADYRDNAFELQVMSTGAPMYSLAAPSPSSVVSPSVPVSGDAVISINGPDNPWGNWADVQVGLEVVCLNNPTAD